MTTPADVWDQAIAWARHNRDAIGRDVLDGTFNPYRPLPQPPAPTTQPGDVAIATVRGVEGVRVMRTMTSKSSDRYLWASARHVDGNIIQLDDEVTVTSLAVVVTEADRDELLRRVPASAAPWAHQEIRHWLEGLDGERP